MFYTFPVRRREHCWSQLLLVAQPGATLCPWQWVGLSKGIQLHFWQPEKYPTCSSRVINTASPPVFLLFSGPSTPSKSSEVQRARSLCWPAQLRTRRPEPHQQCWASGSQCGHHCLATLLPDPKRRAPHSAAWCCAARPVCWGSITQALNHHG